MAAQMQTRRARDKAAGGRLTAEDIHALLERQEYRCAAPHCRIDLLWDFHLDHKTPISRGGGSEPENMQILCPPCNMSKGARTMEEWIVDRARHAEAEVELAERLGGARNQ